MFTIHNFPHILKTRRDDVKFLESIINIKLNAIKSGELFQLARQHGVSLTMSEAEQISQLLRGKNYNLFDPTQRKGIVNNIATIIGTSRASQIEQLFLSLTGR